MSRKYKNFEIVKTSQTWETYKNSRGPARLYRAHGHINGRYIEIGAGRNEFNPEPVYCVTLDEIKSAINARLELNDAVRGDYVHG